MKEDRLSYAAVTSAVAYSFCSSTLLIINKSALGYLPYPSFLLILQFLFTSIAIATISVFQISNVDQLEWPKVKYYLLYVACFVATIYSNMKALSNVNVETVIVFRSCTPIAVSIIEYLFMNRSIPSLRSSLSLVGVAFGAVIYCLYDSQLQVDGWLAYLWVFIYFFLITLEMTYAKQITSAVKMDSVWGQVYYCSLLSLPILSLMEVLDGGLNNKIDSLVSLSLSGWAMLFMSCLLALLIGYSGWLCRGMVSATTFTLIGVLNKFATVILNVMFFQKHASSMGIVAVFICLACGTFYQQAPLREIVKRET